LCVFGFSRRLKWEFFFHFADRKQLKVKRRKKHFSSPVTFGALGTVGVDKVTLVASLAGELPPWSAVVGMSGGALQD
jgi:hypothetical protein